MRPHPHSPDSGRICAGVLMMALLLCGKAAAAGDEDSIEEIRAQIEALRSEYDQRLSALERRLEELAAPSPSTESTEAEPEAQSDELAALRRAALEAVEEASSRAASQAPSAPSTGRERNLNLFNPEISFTGIVVGVAAPDGRDEFGAREFELDLQSALDPFSRTRWTIAFGDEGVEIEEGYIQYSSLPGGLDLLAGKFRQRFGALNRQHLHALPQTDYPLVYQAYFGEEGLAQTGLSFSWLLPELGASANRLTVEITNGENEVAFAGELFDDFSALARFQSFWETGPATWLEWGVSGIAGKGAAGEDSKVYGTDLTFHWQPPSRAKYRELTWRTELLRSERDRAGQPTREATGLYTYLEGLLARNLYAGVRFDQVEDPFDPTLETRGFSPYLTWWQSEYVRLRTEYGRLENRLTGREEDRFTLQITFAAGPHKHESYD